MVSHRNFPDSAHAILEPDTRWFPAYEAWGGSQRTAVRWHNKKTGKLDRYEYNSRVK
jgi:hypothetical protein